MTLDAAKARLVVGLVQLSVDFDLFLAEALAAGLLLVDHSIERAEVGLAIVATTATALAWECFLGAERRLIVVRLPLHMIVAIVQKPDEPVYLVPGLFAEAPYGLEDLFGGNVGLKVKLTSGVRWPFYGGLHGGLLCGFGFSGPSPRVSRSSRGLRTRQSDELGRF
ncbi:hypothetical protein [Bradyrhizobium sp. 6(2017)]|uniref:hypothetical protein n=1 Tax=Bradyrhizobium sp. 6(2017) TaxID=1197460 RepID=UPI0013E179C2|nr:hypothetical protein [Bradyrhizobium sp. 6(2017)]QIG91985.1 hypothetical protein G6P99_05355 [Bradyrhizobium sp. 6(2017)]